MAVISLVNDAMGTTLSASRAISTRPVASSSTRAWQAFTLDGKGSSTFAEARVRASIELLPCDMSPSTWPVASVIRGQSHARLAAASRVATNAGFQEALRGRGTTSASMRRSRLPPRAGIASRAPAVADVARASASNADASRRRSPIARAASSSATSSRSARRRADSHHTTGWKNSKASAQACSRLTR